MFKVSFRDANDAGRKFGDPISMYAIPEVGESVTFRERKANGISKNMTGRVTGRTWHIITKEQGFEVEILVVLNNK